MGGPGSYGIGHTNGGFQQLVLSDTTSLFGRHHAGFNNRVKPITKNLSAGPGSYGIVHIMNHEDMKYTFGHCTSPEPCKTDSQLKPKAGSSRKAAKAMPRTTRTTNVTRVPAFGAFNKYRRSVLPPAGIYSQERYSH